MTHRSLQSAVLLAIAGAGLLSSVALAEGGFKDPEQPSIRAVQMGPAISALEPQAGPAGTQVTIKGSNLAGVTKVVFSPGREAPFSVVSDSAVQATVPDGAQTGPIQVESATGVSKSRDAFNVASE